MKDLVVLRVIAKLLMPTILLFALYVQLHGDYSPGGGFQAGILFAAAIVLYTLIYGLDAAERVIPPPVAHALCAIGALLYLGIGVLAMLFGGNFLDYNTLADNPQTGQHIGIVLIELGVGITVAGVSITLFFAFAGRGR
jgi:multicomponent Na+:H+ antiporter subunit B